MLMTDITQTLWTNLAQITSDRIITQNMKKIKQRQHKTWKSRWKSYTKNLRIIVIISSQREFLDKMRLKVHEKLSKVESALITQIRTKKIEFADFLHKRKVSRMKHARCSWEWHRQIAKHVIMFYSMMKDKTNMLRVVDSNDYARLTRFSAVMKAIIKWIMKHNLLSQFSSTSESLYQKW
jgi:hypothetical protein